MFTLGTTPFSPTSSWNTPVGSNASYIEINWPGSTGYNYSVNWDSYSPAVYVASSTDPVVQVGVPGGWGYPGGMVSVQMPLAANGAAGTDGELLVVDGDTVYNFWQFNRTTATTATASSYGETNAVTGTGWGTQSPFLSAGTTAVGSSELGGLLVKAETDTGQINHALQLAVDSNLVKSGFTGNAIAGDGSASSGIVQEGDHLAIAPGTPMPSGLSPLGQEVFRAMQQYGSYVVDVAGGTTAIRAQANAYDNATITALDHDMGSITPLLEEVHGGTPTSSGSTSSSGTTSGGATVTSPTSGTSSDSTSASGGTSSSGNTGTASDGSSGTSSGGTSPGDTSSSGTSSGSGGTSGSGSGGGTSLTTPTATGGTSGGTTASDGTSSGGATTDPTGDTSSGGSSVTDPSGSTSPGTSDATGTSAAQTTTATDPPAVTTSSDTSTTTPVTSSGTSTTTSEGGRSWRQSHHHLDLAQSFNHHPDFARAATTLSEAGASSSGVVSAPATTSDPAGGAGAKAYALLNQMMAGDFGRESHFAQAGTASSAWSQHQANLLTRPLH